ncbi:MAG TPA: hypothetical protein VEI83_02970 [Acidimicrobiales bacterium]|nr:hypothetical protein [Acidimicrobiales bacterium]
MKKLALTVAPGTTALAAGSPTHAPVGGLAVVFASRAPGRRMSG